MKDGFVAVYISGEDWLEFIKKQGNFSEDTCLVVGRPKDEGCGEIIIEVAFSETDSRPEDWGGDNGKKVKEIIDSWENK